MATNDTIPGKIRLVRVDTEGNKEVVAGPFGSSELDDVNQTFNPEDYLYLNTILSGRKSAPGNARELAAPDAQYESGEELHVEFVANATVSNDVDHDFDAFTIEVLRRDKNRGRIYPDTLTVADQELSSDPTESTSDYVTIFKETVPDRQEYRVVGRVAAAAIEN